MADQLLGRHFISLFLIYLFAIRLGSQRSARDKGLNYFWLTVVSCFLLVVEDSLEKHASLYPELRDWRIFLSVAGYFLRSTAVVGLVILVARPTRRGKWLWQIPCLINLLVCSTAFFSDIAFGFDESYKFYRGPLGYVPFIVPGFYLLAILILTFRNYRERGRQRDRLILISCAVLCLLSALLDSTRGGVRLHEAIMISSIFFYIYLRSYDVRRDSLTLVLNRQSLYDDCENLGKSLFAAASLDMNGLKKINNTQGQHTGDEALRKIGECLREKADQEIRAYRFGGDEFVLLFFQPDEDAVRETLDSIRSSVRKAGYSIACGYAIRKENEDPESLIRRSDLKMFEEKARYYREKRHDRRRHLEDYIGRYPGDDMRKALEESPQPAAVYQFIDHRYEALAVSDGFCRMFGYQNRQKAIHVLDQNMYRQVHPDDRERLSGAILRFSDGDELDVVYRTGAGLEAGYRVVHARGTHLHTGTEDRVAHVWYMDEGMYVEGDEAAGSMMTQALNRALHEESILNATHYDHLTGLFSLDWFFKLHEARRSRTEHQGPQALLYLDLSGMKYFNDRNGFAEGDKLLKAFADLLVQTFGKENCCHISADRFAADAAEAGLEERLQKLFKNAERMNNGNSLPVRVGIYAAGSPETSSSFAFDRAKIACDNIRHSDVSCFNRYTKEMNDAVRRRQYIISNIDRAVREKWIRPYYQPIVSAADERVVHEEALARWIDPTEGFLAPSEFIPHLEDTGLNYKLDLCILDQTIEKISSRRKAGLETVPQSVNLSRSDFEGRDMAEEVRKRVDAAGIPHEMICIEITESIIGSDFDFINEQVKRFRKYGFSVWMDDFGSGYSSLHVLQSIQFDLIKFDMSFMQKLDEGENGRIILTELMKLAEQLKLDTVCEGVEKEEQVRFLQEIGCSKLQGYYFSEPVPYEPEKAMKQTDGKPSV